MALRRLAGTEHWHVSKPDIGRAYKDYIEQCTVKGTSERSQ